MLKPLPKRQSFAVNIQLLKSQKGILIGAWAKVKGRRTRSSVHSGFTGSASLHLQGTLFLPESSGSAQPLSLLLCYQILPTHPHGAVVPQLAVWSQGSWNASEPRHSSPHVPGLPENSSALQDGFLMDKVNRRHKEGSLGWKTCAVVCRSSI